MSEPSTVSWHIQIFLEASWNLQVDLLIVYVVAAGDCPVTVSHTCTTTCIVFIGVLLLFACVSTDSPIFKPDSFVHQFIDLMIYLLVNPYIVHLCLSVIFKRFVMFKGFRLRTHSFILLLYSIMKQLYTIS